MVCPSPCEHLPVRSNPRHLPSYRWLLLLLAVDAFALASLLFNQWLGGAFGQALAPAALATVAAIPWLSRLADKVFDMAGTT